MTHQELAAAQKEIETCAINAYSDKDAGEAVLDGVIKPETYLKAPIKIMWFLKEPHDGGGVGRISWSLIKDHFLPKSPSKLGGRTFYPIIYLNHALLTGEHVWENIPEVADVEEEARRAICSMAFINAKKQVGDTSSVDRTIKDWFKKGRRVIDRQIQAYDPDVIFACGPHAAIFFNENGLSLGNGAGSTGSAWYAWIEERLWIYVYHPNQKTVAWKTYFEDALQAVIEGIKERPGRIVLPVKPA